MKVQNEKKLKTEKNKKGKLLLLLALGGFMILGSTLAYFTTSDIFTNIFKTATYQPQIIETFESPSDWTPGTTTPKAVIVRNNGSIDMAVRASYEEKWINANGEEIALTDSDNNVASIINFNDDWEKNEDGYYYFGKKSNLTKLKPAETSSSFISGVTFNENIKANLVRTEEADRETITYQSSGDSYDGANYILTIKIDTIQFDQALSVW